MSLFSPNLYVGILIPKIHDKRKGGLLGGLMNYISAIIKGAPGRKPCLFHQGHSEKVPAMTQEEGLQGKAIIMAN